MYFSIEKEHSSLSVTVTSEIEKTTTPAIDMGLYNNTTAEEVKKELQDNREGGADIWQYTLETPMTAWNDDIQAYALESFSPGRPLFDAARELMTRIYQDFEFKPGATTIATPLSTVMRERKGVCQDFAHLLITVVRSWGLPARYAMGYMRASVEGYDDSKDEEATHAWAEVLVPGVGWRGFDPTNRLCANDQYISVAVGRDYLDAAPQRGTFKGSAAQEVPSVRVVLQQQSPQTVPSEDQQKQTAQ